jgi:choline monooxygenase
MDQFDPKLDIADAVTLNSSHYFNSETHSSERLNIFAKTWQLAGYADQLPKTGSFFTVDWLAEPLIILRDKQNKIRAMSNVCRHRASLLLNGSGTVASIRCPYHSWTYDLTGQLTSQPEFEGVKGFDKNDICQPSYEVATWGPFIFVKLMGVLRFEEWLGNIPKDAAKQGYDMEHYQFVGRREYVIECNWKVYVDNYLEGYHIPAVHPALFKELDYANYRVETYQYYSEQIAPLRKATDATKENRKYLPGEGPQPLYYWMFPNVMLNFYPDQMHTSLVIPISPTSCRVVFDWYLLPEHINESDDFLAKTFAFNDQVQKEDMEICESVQKGLSSLSYKHGRFSVKRENGVYHFHRLVYTYLDPI